MDRTVHIELELTEEECAALRCEDGGDGFSRTVRDHKRAVVDKLRAALSSSLEQGREAEQIVARIVSHWLVNRETEIRAGQPLSGTPHGIAQEILAALPTQPPAPALSDEAAEELKMIALALKNQGIESVTPERGVELLIERLYAQRLSDEQRERSDCAPCHRPS